MSVEIPTLLTAFKRLIAQYEAPATPLDDLESSQEWMQYIRGFALLYWRAYNGEPGFTYGSLDDINIAAYWMLQLAVDVHNTKIAFKTTLRDFHSFHERTTISAATLDTTYYEVLASPPDLMYMPDVPDYDNFPLCCCDPLIKLLTITFQGLC